MRRREINAIRDAARSKAARDAARSKAAPPVHANPPAFSGELVETDRVRIICGDSTDPNVRNLALGGNRPDTVIFDPPYNSKNLWSHMPRPSFCRALLVFYDSSRAGRAIDWATSLGWKLHNQLIWDCGGVSFRHDNEPDWAHKCCGLFGEFDWSTRRASSMMPKSNRASTLSTRVRFSDVYKHDKRSKLSGHKHIKPWRWIACILAGVGATRLVYDPFMGGPSSMKASLEWGVKYAGVEINPDTFEKTAKEINSPSGDL